MVMQQIRPVYAYNQGAVQMSAAPAGSVGVSGGVSGNLSTSTGGQSVGTVLAVATLGLVLFYLFTHSIQGSV
jgi:hypothetical protein